MLDYSLPGATPSDSAVVWSRAPLQPLAGGVLTPLSASVLTELLRRAWFAYYDRLGFDPAPLTRMVRIHNGRAYLNLSVSARLDGDQAALEPLTLRINGHLYPLATVEKPGFLAGFKVRGKRKQVEQLPQALLEEMPAIVQRAEAWCTNALDMRWSQAEVLQIMEEIEFVGLEGMTAFFAARHNLERLYNRLLHALPDLPADAATNGATANAGVQNTSASTTSTSTTTHKVLRINSALSDLHDLVEVELTHALVAMSRSFAGNPSAAEWFAACGARHGQEEPPSPEVQDSLDEFLRCYGHRGLDEGELANARWAEDRDPVLRAVHGCIRHKIEPPAKIPAAQAVQHLLDAAQGDKGEIETTMEQIRDWHKVQSRALHALAYVWTGTRHWALAAASEAGSDGRVQQPEDIFFYELEEIKQMMTGEWNISDLEGIHAVCAQRKTDYATWQSQEPAELLLDDREATPLELGIGAVGGQVAGPLHHWRETRKNGNSHAIAAAHVFDSGWSVALPVIHGAVSAGGSPLDPFVAAARVWHRPTVVGLGQYYGQLVEGAQTTVDSQRATVEQ